MHWFVLAWAFTNHALYYHIKDWTKWTIFCWRYIQKHFSFSYFNNNFTELLSWESIWQKSALVRVVVARHRTGGILWNNDLSVEYWHIYALAGLNVSNLCLIHSTCKISPQAPAFFRGHMGVMLFSLSDQLGRSTTGPMKTSSDIIMHDSNFWLNNDFDWSRTTGAAWHYWKSRVVMLLTMPSLGTPQIVVMTNCGATSDDKVDIMTRFSVMVIEQCPCMAFCTYILNNVSCWKVSKARVDMW